MRAGKNYPMEQYLRVPRFIFLPARISAGPRVLLRVNPVTVPLLNWACFRYLKHHNNRTYRSSLVMPSTNFSIFIYFKNIYYFIWFNFFINLIFYIIVEILVWLKVNLGVHKMLNAAKYVLITFVTFPHKNFLHAMSHTLWKIACWKSPSVHYWVSTARGNKHPDRRGFIKAFCPTKCARARIKARCFRGL